MDLRVKTMGITSNGINFEDAFLTEKTIKDGF
jgi:hypothetical protein